MPIWSLGPVVLGVGLCALAFIPNRRLRALCYLRGIGFQAVAVVPVGIAQALWVMEGTEFTDVLRAPLAGVPFNTGGMVCAAAFESIDRAGLMPARQVTVHAGVYLPLVLAQASVVAGVIAGRIRETGRLLGDRVTLMMLAGVVANSVLGITWPWWGS